VPSEYKYTQFEKVLVPNQIATRKTMNIFDFSRRLVTMVVLWLPGGYGLATSQRRYILLYRMRRPHEYDFRALRLLGLNSSCLMLDIGANVGQSVLSFYTVFPQARAVSFEPNPETFNKLQRLTARFPQLQVYPSGVSDEVGEAELFIPSYNGNALTGLASFDYESAKLWLGKTRVLRFDPRKLTVSSRKVPLVRLDDLGLEPDFIKIDVQGFEHRVLVGGMETIRKCRPVIMAETVRHGSDAYKIMQPLGYRLVEFDGRNFTEIREKNWRLNQFLIPAERLPSPNLE
jgi:FkbM family methyltransferase